MAAEDQMEGSMPLSDTVTQLQELYSFKSDKMPKARKPYTISKQREKWTEEEHQKFLEAIKLYGRGWRQIEEHVGTKTAVQIRSHAQKFFSKVVREPNDISEVSIKPTEIPPPRPKRKPMHPYPRKCVDSSKALLLAMKPEGSLSPSELLGEQENKTLATVLAAFTSDVLGSPVSEQEHGCSSPTSCTTNIQSMNVSFAEKDSEYATSKSSTEEEKASLSSVQASGYSALEDFLSMNCKDSIRVEQGAKEMLRSNSIKLFGRTVVVTDTEKPHVLGAGSLDANDELPFQTLKSKKLDTQLSLGSISSGDALNPDTEKPDLIKPTPQAPSPQCPLYQTLPFYYLTSFKPTIAHTSIDACVSERNKEKETLDEQSCSGSDAGSVSQTENKEKSSDIVDSQFRQPCYEEKDSLWKSAAKGFVPYKRCLAERDVSSSMAVFEEQKRQRTRVCS